MNKKNLLITGTILILVIFCLIYINNKNEQSKDSYKFKQEYEKLNGKKNTHGSTNRTVEIDKNNSIKYSSAKDIVDRVNKKETFVVYFGFAECPWCRSVVENLIAAANNKKVNTIYYVDVKNIRDVKEVKDGEVVTTTKGNKYYMELLERFNNVLADYALEDSEGNSVKTNEKRIYAPNIVAVTNGKAKELTDGTSSKQKDPYMKLTNGMNKESVKKIECIFKCLNESNVCTSKTSC